MMPTRQTLLEALPPFHNEWELDANEQGTGDIIHTVLKRHAEFRPYYDRLALYFDNPDPKELSDELFRFCKKYLKYREEPEERQTVSIPTGLLVRGSCDCKGYASFCAGILDALNRKNGTTYKWAYRFASYDALDPVPHHVFTVLSDPDYGEIWIDPTPGSEGKDPVWQLDKTVKSTMPLLSNIGSVRRIGAASALPSQVRMASGSAGLASNNAALAAAWANVLAHLDNFLPYQNYLEMLFMAPYSVDVAYYWNQDGNQNYGGPIDTVWSTYFQAWLSANDASAYANYQSLFKNWHDNIWQKYENASRGKFLKQVASIANGVVKTTVGIDLGLGKPIVLPAVPNVPPGTTSQAPNNLLGIGAPSGNSLLYAGLAGAGTYLLMKKNKKNRLLFAALAGGAVFLLTRKPAVPVMTNPGVTTQLPSGQPAPAGTGVNAGQAAQGIFSFINNLFGSSDSGENTPSGTFTAGSGSDTGGYVDPEADTSFSETA